MQSAYLKLEQELAHSQMMDGGVWALSHKTS